MSRNSFFSNVPKDDLYQSTPDPKTTSDANTSTPTKNLQSPTIRSKRLTYSIKIDPTIRKSIKDWAVQHDVTISSVIEALARNHLKDLSRDDIEP